MRLNDSVIAHIAKLIQLGILSGTDIVDNIRMIRLRIASEEGELTDELFLTEDYEVNADNNIEKMLTEVSTLTGNETEA
jgi:hypothetical protein